MGTQVFTAETETDAENIIQYTRKPKKPPEYIPRSRSLEDLPGGLRVPILKKPESRLQQKHEANEAGLEELKLLRQKHGQMMDDLKTGLSSSEMGTRKSSGIRLSSVLSLASIKEEPVSHDINENNLESQISKVRFSIASNESQTASSDNSDIICNSTESLYLSQRNQVQDTTSDGYSHEKVLVDSWKNFEQNFADYSNKKPIQARRRASIQVETLSNRLPPPVDGTICPKLRRASFQCEAVLTKKFDREEPVSKIISEFKLKYDFPSPLHAVTRQYGSSSDIRMQDRMAESVTTDKDFKSILHEWQNEKNTTTQRTTQMNILQDNKHNEEKRNTETNSCHHSRNLSMTSDYFGSTETLNTVKTFPLQSRENIQIFDRRRQSLPVILTRNVTEPVPKLPERRRSYTSKNIESAKSEFLSKNDLRKKISSRTLSNVESDDGIFNEEDEPLKSNGVNINGNTDSFKKTNKTSEIVAKLTLETAL